MKGYRTCSAPCCVSTERDATRLVGWVSTSVYVSQLLRGSRLCRPSCNYESYVGNLSTVTVLNTKWLFVVGLASLKQENLQLLAVMFRFVKHFITQETVWWPFQCSNLCLGKAQVTTASSHHNIYWFMIRTSISSSTSLSPSLTFGLCSSSDMK